MKNSCRTTYIKGSSGDSPNSPCNYCAIGHLRRKHCKSYTAKVQTFVKTRWNETTHKTKYIANWRLKHSERAALREAPLLCFLTLLVRGLFGYLTRHMNSWNWSGLTSIHLLWYFSVLSLMFATHMSMRWPQASPSTPWHWWVLVVFGAATSEPLGVRVDPCSCEMRCEGPQDLVLDLATPYKSENVQAIVMVRKRTKILQVS